MKIGSKIKNFNAEMTGKSDFNLADYQGKKLSCISTPEIILQVVLPKEKILEIITNFPKKNTVIFGISKDSIKSHENFKEKFNFPLN